MDPTHEKLIKLSVIRIIIFSELVDQFYHKTRQLCHKFVLTVGCRSKQGPPGLFAKILTNLLFSEEHQLQLVQQVAPLGVAFGSRRTRFKVMASSQFPGAMEVTTAEVEVVECLLYITNRARYFLTSKSLVGLEKLQEHQE